jgi:putative ABC transport system permease protein
LKSTEVLGVVPGDQTFPDNTDLWLNMTWPMTIQGRNARWMTAIGRMSDGVGVDRAQEDMSRIATRLAETHQDNVGWGVTVNLLSHEIVGRAGSALWILFGATGLVLLICCGNVANLLLARSEVRRQEMAIRTAFGAGRGRLARQLFTESLLLAGIGAIGGLGLAWASMKALHRLAPAVLPRVAEVGIDGTVLLVLLASTILTGVLFGTVPVLRIYHGKAFGGLRDGARRTQSRSQHRVQSGFVVGQLALAVVVVVGSGLLVKSFAKLSAVDMGFQDTGVLTFEMDLSDAVAPDAESVGQFYEQYIEALRARPEVVTAGMASNLPLGEALDYNQPFRISDRATDEETRTYHRHASPGFFETLQTPILAGRSFLPSDNMGGRGVVVINETAANTFWPDGNALGARLEGLQAQWGPLGWVRVDEAEVVGIVADLAYHEIGSGAEPAIYYSFRQAPMRRMFITLRGVGDPEGLLSVARSALAEVNPALPISNPRVLKDIVASAKATDRFSMILFTLFGVLGLILASIGVYGVLAFAVEQRVAELGIRMALGASAGTVRSMVLREGSVLLLGGLLIGSIAALALGGLVSTLLFGVSPRDPLVFGAVFGILTVVGLLASFLPAQRATRVSPASAMRRE